MNTQKSGLWTNKIVKTKLPIEYNRKQKFGIARTTVYLILDEQYRKRTYANTKHNFTREYMRKKKYESQIYKKQILEKINKGE